MKRLLPLLLTFCILLSAFCTFLPAFAAEDTCTSHSYTNGFCTDCGGYQPAVLNENGYYEIGNAGQLYWFSDKVNSGSAYINAVLTDNITVNPNLTTELITIADNLTATVNEGKTVRSWTPIGITYYATFEGNGKTISGLYFNDGSVNSVGLFNSTHVNTIGSASIQNVSVVDSYFHGNYSVGGIVGNGGGTITNCHNAAYVSGTAYVGGIAGKTTTQ